MRREKRWRYYCEFCKKSGASGYHIQRHENACTMNPNRHCKMCEIAGLDQKPIEVLVDAIEDLKISQEADSFGMTISLTGDEKETIEQLRDIASGCPACMLAALRQSGIAEFVNWRFEDEKKDFWEWGENHEIHNGIV